MKIELFNSVIYRIQLVMFLLLILFFVSYGNAVADNVLRSKDFMVFESTLYKNKPSDLGHGVKYVPVIYEKRFWPDNVTDHSSLPDESHVRKLMRGFKTDSNYVVLDIECWPIRGYTRKLHVVQESIEKYLTVLNWVKDERPDLEIGYFGFPKNNYVESQGKMGSKKYIKHQSEIDLVRPIFSEVNILYPSAYTFEPSFSKWKDAFDGMISKVRKIYTGRIHVFMSPSYIESKYLGNFEVANRMLPVDLWRKQLEYAYKYADGIIIWGGWKDHNGVRLQWDPNYEWWIETKLFMKSKSIN